MKSPFKILADFITARPKIVAVAVIIWFLIAAYGMSLIYMKTGDDTYIDKDTPRGVTLENYKEMFSSSAIMLIYESDDVLDPKNLQYMESLQDQTANEDGARTVAGITDMIKAVNNGELPSSTAETDRIKNMLPAELLEKYLPSNTMTIAVVNLDTGISDDKEEALLNNLKTLITISDMPPDMTVTVSGSPAFSQQMGEEMGKSTGTLIFAAMLLMVVAVGILFAHVSYRFLPVGVVFTGLISTFGVMGLADIPISMVVIAAFPVLIGIGIDYAIQFHSRLDDEIKHGAPVEKGVRTTIENSGPSILYAMIATSLGFIAMYVSPIPMVVDFGLTCLIGVICCYLAALVMVPTFGILIGYKPKEKKKSSSDKKMEQYDSFLGNLSHNIAKSPLYILLILGFIAILGIQLDNEVPISFDEQTFVPPDMPAVVDMKKVTRTMGSTDTLTAMVRGDDVLNPDVIEWIDDFGEYEISSRNEITGVTSIATLVKKYNGGTIPESEAEIIEIVSSIPESEKEPYINGHMTTVLQFSMLDLEPDIAESLINNVKRDLTWNYPPPGIDAVLTGSTEMSVSLIKSINDGKAQMTYLGFFLIFVWLIFIYRRVTAITPIIPIIMIVGWNGAIMYGLGIDYTPMTAVLGSMTIGIASEYTILIMERYTEERKNGKEKLEAIRIGVQKIGSAITVSGMTTVFGFSALLLSGFNIIKNFGMVTVITVGFSLIGAIVVMPAVLSIMGRFEKPYTDDEIL
ncbi:efflux RND transporter permease subunit [Methanoplanus endosymbiosus]|uniref:Hydrophobe/amphiphile efflux-3 (HAE3) family transporter n=1 Tax=Methanoplanus endosymbiosus TaxID=33865 RepID=A0A9E7TH38_9EURY|nr:hydrophobe/amphiphile efflux-3 (HAE3) family transporter [Methanoplanus endosymbiosus]UUX92157.1 hydrophobe/amphiphile efflux-3 (HAE3) family transporter [Methanoplanus endosymbiosus]